MTERKTRRHLEVVMVLYVLVFGSSPHLWVRWQLARSDPPGLTIPFIPLPA